MKTAKKGNERVARKKTVLKKSKSGVAKAPSARYPRLDTVIMVENAIRKYDGEFKKKALWEHLPKKMMYQTYCVVIDYLLHSYKISIDAEGKIGWIYYPEKVRELMKHPELIWRGE